MLEIRWVWLFLHHDKAQADAAWSFWPTVTGSSVSPVRGAHGEFATLLPREGDGWVKLQRVDEVRSDIHVDLVVDDVAAAADQACALGANLDQVLDDVRVLRSPGGFAFCFTSWDNEARPQRQVRDGEAIVLDQACLDIPQPLFEREVAFWSELTGWQAAHGLRPEYRWLQRPERIPVRFLLQRLGNDDPRDSVAGHADVACGDRVTVVKEHVAAGAAARQAERLWTVLQDPGGLIYCLTDRDPRTGQLL